MITADGDPNQVWSGCNSQLLTVLLPPNLQITTLNEHIRSITKSHSVLALIKNGKFFQLPVRSNDDFKTLFARVAASGVGRPVDKDGCPQGPWTPDLLADAICHIEANRAGIELRTVQLWFENNDKGISAQNIRWLARVLGCNDPVGASAWQVELAAAQSRLAAKRRERRRGPVDELAVPDGDDAETLAMLPNPSAESTGRFGLVRATEALFASGSLLNLPATIFAGAVALQLLSYFLSIHDVTYQRDDGVAKQVGFLWAPNWTFLFVVFLPLYLTLVRRPSDTTGRAPAEPEFSIA